MLRQLAKCSGAGQALSRSASAYTAATNCGTEATAVTAAAAEVSIADSWVAAKLSRGSPAQRDHAASSEGAGDAVVDENEAPVDTYLHRTASSSSSTSHSAPVRQSFVDDVDNEGTLAPSAKRVRHSTTVSNDSFSRGELAASTVDLVGGAHGVFTSFGSRSGLPLTPSSVQQWQQPRQHSQFLPPLTGGEGGSAVYHDGSISSLLSYYTAEIDDDPAPSFLASRPPSQQQPHRHHHQLQQREQGQGFDLGIVIRTVGGDRQGSSSSSCSGSSTPGGVKRSVLGSSALMFVLHVWVATPSSPSPSFTADWEAAREHLSGLLTPLSPDASVALVVGVIVHSMGVVAASPGGDHINSYPREEDAAAVAAATLRSLILAELRLQSLPSSVVVRHAVIILNPSHPALAVPTASFLSDQSDGRRTSTRGVVGGVPSGLATGNITCTAPLALSFDALTSALSTAAALSEPHPRLLKGVPISSLSNSLIGAVVTSSTSTALLEKGAGEAVTACVAAAADQLTSAPSVVPMEDQLQHFRWGSTSGVTAAEAAAPPSPPLLLSPAYFSNHTALIRAANVSLAALCRLLTGGPPAVSPTPSSSTAAASSGAGGGVGGSLFSDGGGDDDVDGGLSGGGGGGGLLRDTMVVDIPPEFDTSVMSAEAATNNTTSRYSLSTLLQGVRVALGAAIMPLPTLLPHQPNMDPCATATAPSSSSPSIITLSELVAGVYVEAQAALDLLAATPLFSAAAAASPSLPSRARGAVAGGRVFVFAAMVFPSCSPPSSSRQQRQLGGMFPYPLSGPRCVLSVPAATSPSRSSSYAASTTSPPKAGSDAPSSSTTVAAAAGAAERRRRARVQLLVPLARRVDCLLRAWAARCAGHLLATIGEGAAGSTADLTPAGITGVGASRLGEDTCGPLGADRAWRAADAPASFSASSITLPAAFPPSPTPLIATIILQEYGAAAVAESEDAAEAAAAAAASAAALVAVGRVSATGVAPASPIASLPPVSSIDASPQLLLSAMATAVRCGVAAAQQALVVPIAAGSAGSSSSGNTTTFSIVDLASSLSEWQSRADADDAAGGGSTAAAAAGSATRVVGNGRQQRQSETSGPPFSSQQQLSTRLPHQSPSSDYGAHPSSFTASRGYDPGPEVLGDMIVEEEEGVELPIWPRLIESGQGDDVAHDGDWEGGEASIVQFTPLRLTPTRGSVADVDLDAPFGYPHHQQQRQQQSTHVGALFPPFQQELPLPSLPSVSAVAAALAAEQAEASSFLLHLQALAQGTSVGGESGQYAYNSTAVAPTHAAVIAGEGGDDCGNGTTRGGSSLAHPHFYGPVTSHEPVGGGDDDDLTSLLAQVHYAFSSARHGSASLDATLRVAVRED